jgi:3'-5' exoribonuclease
MAKGKPAVVPLHQLAPHQPADFFALLAEKTRKTTRDGRTFFELKFRDLRRTVAVAVWPESDLFPKCESELPVGGFYKLRGTFSEHPKYGPQVEVVQLREVRDGDAADGFKEADFFDRSRFDAEAMFAEVRALAEAEIADLPLRKLTVELLDAHAAVLKPLPATKDRFFPFPGGWLEHVVGVTKNCLFLVDRYRAHYPELNPPLNRDVVVSSAILHDLGRVAELQLPPVPGQPVGVSVDGELFGHQLLCRDLVRDHAKSIPELNPDLLKLLEHVIVAHLALPAWGSLRLPAVPEVLILHHADDLDAKMEMYARCLIRDPSAGPFTDPDPVLKRPLWKSRTV